MSLVLKAIQEKMEMDEISQSALAEVARLSPSAIGFFLQGKQEINFYAMLKVIRFLFPPDLEQDYMENYILSLNKKENIRMAIEYSYLNDIDHLMEYLTEREVMSNNRLNTKWASLYKLFHDMYQRRKPPSEALKELRFHWNDNKDMYVLARIMETVAYYYKKDYRTMMGTSTGLCQEINDLNNEFIRDCFTTRISIIYAGYFLKFNQLERAREYAQKVIDLNLSQRHVGKAYHVLALTYCFREEETTLRYLYQSKEILSDIPREIKEVERTFVFVHNFWHKESLATEDLNEQAHRFIVQGEPKKAMAILDQVPDEEKSPFAYYYYGLACQCMDMLWKSYEMFLASGELYYANLPRHQLIKNGADEISVNTAYQALYKNAEEGVN